MGEKPPSMLAEIKQRRSSAAVFSDTTSADAETQRRHKIFSVVRFTIVLALLIVIILSLVDAISLMDTVGDTIVDDMRDMGVGGGFVYALMCIAFVILCLPNSLLALAAGYIWENTGYGFLAAYPGIMMGAVVSFWLGRVLFREFLETELRSWLKFAALSKASEEHGYKAVFFGRLSPIPSGLLNYAFSISAITYVQFVGASAVGLIPIVVLYAKAGSDFFTFFETSELQDVVRLCQGAGAVSATSSVKPEQMLSVLACCEDAAADNMAQYTVDEYPTSWGVSCAVKEILSDFAEEEADPVCMEYVQTNVGLYSMCLAAKGCDFEVMADEADDLECKYNEDTCFGDESAEASNNSCLRDLNNAELWPKIVLPLTLFITLAIVAYFGNRALHKAGLLQISYNLDRQRELLLAEKEALGESSSA